MKIALTTVLMCGAVLVALTAATVAHGPSAVQRTSLRRPKRENRQGKFDSAAFEKELERVMETFKKYDIAQKKKAALQRVKLRHWNYYQLPNISIWTLSGKRSDVGGKDVKALTHQSSDGPYACQMIQRTGLLSRQGVPIFPLWELMLQRDRNANGLLEKPEMDQVTRMLGKLMSCMNRAA